MSTAELTRQEVAICSVKAADDQLTTTTISTYDRLQLTFNRKKANYFFTHLVLYTLFQKVYNKNVVMVTEDRYNVAFLFGCGEFYEVGPRAL
jgi:hypothetical protein